MKVIFDAYHSVSQAVPHNGIVAMSLDTVLADSHSGLQTVGSEYRYYFPRDGYYRLAMHVNFESIGTGVCALYAYHNTSVLTYDARPLSAIAINVLQINRSGRFLAGDYVTPKLFQNSGGIISTLATTGRFFIESIKLDEVPMADVLVLKVREPGQSEEIVAIGASGTEAALKQIAEDIELTALSWADLVPTLASASYAISPNYPNRVYSLTAYSMLT